MKRTFVLVGIITTLAFRGIVSAETVSASGVEITLKGKPHPQTGRPRMPAYNPFYAELTDLGVFLSADSDWSEATVTLSSIEGDYYQTVFDTANGSILLPVNGNAGDSYWLTISVENGNEIEGEFNL